MNPVEEIRNYFSSMNEGKIVQLKSFGEKHHSWAIKIDGAVGVAIQIDPSYTINERFSNARFYTKAFEIENTTFYFLMLTSEALDLRYEFAALCALFLDPGNVGEEREEILSNPIKWWINFKELIGNKTYEKTVHSVLGELVTFCYLYESNNKLEWNGPKGASVDIEDNLSSHEVKSTLLRYDTVVEISSQFQLMNKKQFLYFCRFEKSKTGISIDSISKKIIKLGYSKLKLEEMLKKVGFEENSLVRTEKFKLLEMRKYTIDKNFPVLVIEDIFDEKLIDHIVQVKYRLDLKGLPSKLIDIDFL